jgi:hypothetical protein
MFWNNEKVSYSKLLQIVIQKKQAWIVVRRQSLAFGSEGAIKYLVAENTLLAFQLILFFARPTEKISDWAVVGK